MNIDYQHFAAKFATQEDIPAPFSHVYSLHGHLNGPFELEYSIHYTDREDLTEDEILEEGFTLDDDRQCKGQVPAVWQNEVLRLLTRTKAAKQPKPGTHDLILNLTSSDGSIAELRPGNQPEWEYLLQELAQALLESAKQEAPLHLQFCSQRSAEQQLIQVEISFAERQGQLIQTKRAPIHLPWATCKEVIKLTFTLDLDPELALDHLPKQRGFFVSTVPGQWYEGGVAAKSPSARNNVLGKLEELVANLTNQPSS